MLLISFTHINPISQIRGHKGERISRDPKKTQNYIQQKTEKSKPVKKRPIQKGKE